MISFYIPKIEDLWFRKLFLSDIDTMSYNHAYGGIIDFNESKWINYYNKWITNCGNERYYRYIINEKNEFVGEASYHLDNDCYLVDIIIYSKYRNKGYGKEALKLLCESAKENGIKELYDNIAIDNKAIKLFLDYGFIEIDRNEEMVRIKKEL